MRMNGAIMFIYLTLAVSLCIVVVWDILGPPMLTRKSTATPARLKNSIFVLQTVPSFTSSMRDTHLQRDQP